MILHEGSSSGMCPNDDDDKDMINRQYIFIWLDGLKCFYKHFHI